MKKLASVIAGLAPVLMASAAVNAQVVAIEIHGHVEWNIFLNGPLVSTAVHPGDPAVMSFEVLSSNYVDSPSFPVRGYPIIPGSFALRIGEVDVELEDPTITNVVPYWVIRNNDPMSDGVMFSTSVELPFGVPISLPGASGAPFGMSFMRTFDDGNQPNTVFNSLDILDATGYWGFEWMSVYDFTIEGGGGSPLGVVYDWFSMSLISEPVILEHPAPLNTCELQPASFSVEATGVTTYQWRHNGIPLVDGTDAAGALVAGATLPVLTFDLVTAFHAGQYDCVVTNGGADHFSNAATLTLWPSCVLGDMNCDTGLAFDDTSAFVQALLNPGAFVTCNIDNADINQDGIVNGLDIQPFIDILIP